MKELKILMTSLIPKSKKQHKLKKMMKMKEDSDWRKMREISSWQLSPGLEPSKNPPNLITRAVANLRVQISS